MSGSRPVNHLPEQIDLTKLRQLLAQHFSLDELRVLCFDLNIDYEVLAPGGKEIKVHELVVYCHTHGLSHQLVTAVIEHRPHLSHTTVFLKLEKESSPFKGLRYFEEQDADIFFGRETLRQRLVNHLLPADIAVTGVETFLAIVGASGSGKSSLVRAGLIPAIRSQTNWRIHLITPTAHPLKALATSLTRDSESVTATATLIDDLAQEPRSLDLYGHKLTHDGERLLLVIDQFEELFTQCKDTDTQQAFVDNLMTAVAAEASSITLIITLRADFYHHCAQYDHLREALAAHQVYIGAMNQEELHQAIEGPARLTNLILEPGLVNLLLRDVGNEPGALPLLSHALLETWKRREGNNLTLAGYQASGGVHGAIAQTAETVYREKLTPEQQHIARNIFLELTELGEGTQDTRRRAYFSELIPGDKEASAVETVLSILADARLVTTDRLEYQNDEGVEVVEVAHEALIREWPTLKEWLDQNRESLRIHRQIKLAVNEWEMLHRDASVLYHGARLAQAQEWIQTHGEQLSPNEREFLELSQSTAEAQEREREAARQRELAQARSLAAVAEVSSVASTILDIDRLAMSVVELTKERFELYHAEIYLVNEDRTRLTLTAGTGEAGRQMILKRHEIPLDAEASIARAARTNDTVVINETQQLAAYTPQPLLSETRSELAVPIVIHDQVIGVLAVQSTKANRFNEYDVQTLQILASQLSVAFQNASSYSELIETAARLGSMLEAEQYETAKNQAILESIADGVLVADDQGQIILVNLAFATILDIPRDQLLNKSVNELPGLYSRSDNSWIDTIATWSEHVESINPGTSLTDVLALEDRIVNVLLSPVISNNQFLGTVSIFRDITKDIEVDRLKSEFISTVSHELRTPMTSIKGYADLMLMEAAGPLNEAQTRFVQVMKNNADRLHVLVNDLLTIGRFERGQTRLDLRPTDLAEVVARVVDGHVKNRLRDENRSLTIHNEIDALPLVKADEVSLSQILVNLIDNAINYTPDPGELRLRAQVDEGFVYVSVSDSGIGIDENDREKVFDRFFRAEDKAVRQMPGTGLGLAIVRSLVEMHGGQILVESQPNEGSTFTFSLPVATE